MAGRGYLENGMGKAASFIREEFRNAGLEPVTENYFQHFFFPVNKFKEVMVVFDGDTLSPGYDYLVSPSSPPLQGTFPVVSIEENDLDKRRKFLKKTAGNIILIPDSLAKKHKSTLEDFSNHTSFEGKAIIYTHVEQLTWSVSGKMSYIPELFVKNSTNIHSVTTGTIKVISGKTHFSADNVIGMRYAEGADSTIIISAHYDHLGKMGDAIFPGANDNASGTAMMLDLAHNLSSKYNLLFIAFAAEEAGLIGSRYFIERPPFDLKKTKIVINLDLVGTGDDGITIVNGGVYKNYFNLIESINDKEKLINDIKARGEACNSDHCFFHLAGIPSFFIYTRGGITAYHDVYDIAETLPLTSYQALTKLLKFFIEGL